MADGLPRLSTLKMLRTQSFSADMRTSLHVRGRVGCSA